MCIGFGLHCVFVILDQLSRKTKISPHPKLKGWSQVKKLKYILELGKIKNNRVSDPAQIRKEQTDI